MSLNVTHTYALMDVSKATFDEIKKKLEDAGYQHAIHETEGEPTALDMHGIALCVEQPEDVGRPVPPHGSGP